MPYITKTFLKTQFDNFSEKISTVFARKKELSKIAFTGKYEDLLGGGYNSY